MASSGAARAAAKRLVVFGGTGFVGSAIAEEATRRGLAVTCVTRTGAPPPHVAAAAWSASVDWRPGNALEPDTYRDALEGADAVVTSVGRLPLPSLTREEVVRDNGETNVAPAREAKRAGVPRLVVVGASIPPFVPGMAFAVDARRGIHRAGYAEGKAIAEAYARDEFLARTTTTDAGKETMSPETKERPERSPDRDAKYDASSAPGAVVLKPGGVSGTRQLASGAAIPLWMALSPASRLLRAVPVDAIAELAPTPVECVARAAVAAAVEPRFAGKFTAVSNLDMLREFA